MNAKVTPIPRPDVRAMKATDNATAAVAALDEHDSIAILTFGQFSIGDLLRALLERTGPATVTIATWTAAKAEIEHAYKMLTDERIISMRWLVDRSFANRQPAYCAALVDRFGADAIRTTRTHAKFLIVRGANGETFSVHTSANLNANPRLESMQIIRGDEHADWLDAICDELWSTLPADELSCDLPAPERLATDDTPTRVSMGAAPSTGPRA